MMYDHVIARRYARALLMSLKGQKLDLVLEQLGSFAHLYAVGSKELQKLFTDPGFSPLDQRAVIKRIAEKSGLDHTLANFLLLLVNKDRMPLILSIYLAFADMVDKQEGRLRVKIASASPISEQELDEIKEILGQLSKKEILTESVVDEKLLGGIRVEAAGAVFDGTLKAKLSAIGNLLLNDIGH